ncbi:hypothetical protein FRX94_04170 [Corynebacterium canis]|uniref:DUF559 domain-containing protein n=1 Tax=Corynebacterium canis TaxID=679663 RepID=A0A5C5UMI3_9CORY|nr:hypothetical protein [Corynebacterium canis]TWT26803.1 hypothetical protein FRX94_04170 [Corynebacterium canis]WJY74484.1 hypothetical protein CCANI_03135 [Corynebacterium canis]
MGLFQRRTKLLDTSFINITRRLAMPRGYCRASREVEWGSRYHPQRLGFAAPIMLRARAHFTQTPNVIIGGWAAAAYAGLKYWVDDAHITVHVASNFQRSHSVFDATRRRLRPGTRVWTPDQELPGMQVVAPEYALVDCLIDLQRDRHSWWVYQVPNLANWEVRAIQLIDALRACTTLNFQLVRDIARNIFSARQLKKLLKLSRTGAQSPPETVLRLIAEQLRQHLEVQIPIYDSGALVDDGTPLLTVLDSGWPDIRVGLFYDGAHHLQRSQRDYDAKVLIRLRELGWEPLRITHGLLQKPRELITTLRRAIHRAETNTHAPKPDANPNG